MTIARHHVRVDEATLARLKRMASQLDPQQHGLTEKNRRLLRQFDDPRNKALLLNLPPLAPAPQVEGRLVTPGGVGQHSPAQGGHHSIAKPPKDPRNFSDQITRCVLSHTGLEIHLHLFRHICAKLHLDAHPGSYEVLTRIMGHRSANTLRAFYCGLEMMAAARHVDAGILAQRTATRPLLARRGRQRSPRKAGR